MKTELLGQEKNVVRVKVEFEAGDFSKNLETAVRELSQQASVPGFRKGHAPRKVIEMRFGREALYAEALEKMLPDAIRQVVNDYDLDTIDEPALKVDEVREGQPVVCELTFEVMPEVSLAALEEIEVEKLISSVPDEELEETVTVLRRDASRLEPVEREARDTDVLEVTFETRILEEGGRESGPQKSDIDLSDGAVRREVREAILGKRAGERAETEFDVEPEYQDPNVAGKRVRYLMTVEQVKERILPDLEPEFFKKIFGEATEIQTEAQFRDEVRAKLLERVESNNRGRALNQAVSLLVERSSLDVPETFVERQVKHLREEDEQDAKKRFGQELSEVLAGASVNEEDYERDLRFKAEAMVRRSLVLDAVGKEHDISVSKEDFDAEIERRAAAIGVEKERLQSIVAKNRDEVSNLLDSLRYRKISDRVMEMVKVKDVEKLSAHQEEGSSAGEDSAE